MIRSRTIRRAGAAGATALAVASLAVAAVPGPSAGADEAFVNGSGRSDATILRMGPSAGRLSLAPTIGLSLADYVGTLGRGESRTADFAALDGSVPAEFKAQLPTVRAESTDDDAGTPHTASFAGTPASSPIRVGGSDQSATATKEPKGASAYTLGEYSVPGVFELGGSTAESHAGVVGGKTREAVGISRISSIKLGGGAVTLNGLTWEAVQRTGEGAVQQANFRVEGVTIGAGPLAQKLAVPDGGSNFDAVVGQINAALKPTGLILRAPTRTTDAGIARVGPLAVSIADSDIGRTALGPILGSLQPIRDPFTGALINANSRFSTAVLLADVAVGVFSGAGRMDVEFGGASAFTEGQTYSNPFGEFSFGSFTLPEGGEGGGSSFDFGSTDGGTAPSTDAGTFSTTGVGTGLATTGAAGLPAAPTTATAAPAARTTGPGNQTAVPLASSRTIEGRRGGAAALIGLFGLLAALGVAYADYRKLRSNRRTIVVS